MNHSSIQRLASSLCAAELCAGSVWVFEGAESGVQFPSEWVVQLDDLHATPSEPAQIIVVDRLTPAVVRRLIDTPPTLLLLTGHDHDPNLWKALHEQCPDLCCLGPGAGLWVDPKGSGARLAIDAAQLQPTASPARIQIAPTPDWILPGLQQLQTKGHIISGWVNTQGLGAAWRELLGSDIPALLSPLCPNPPLIDAKPWDAKLEAVSLAHDLAAPIGSDFPASFDAFSYLARTLVPPSSPEPERRWLESCWNELFLHSGESQRGIRPELPALNSALRSMPPLIALAVQRAQEQLAQWRGQIDEAQALEFDRIEQDPQDAQRSLEVLQAASEQLTDHESKVVLKGWGFEVTRQAIGKSTSAALSYAQKLGYPVALKAISPQLRQKSRANCVALDVANASSLKRHYQKINDLAIQAVGEEQLDGVLVSEMVPAGLDVQLRALKGASGQWSIMARCQLGARVQDNTALAWTKLSSDLCASLRFAARVIPERHPAYDTACKALALELDKLRQPLEELGDRLFCIELDPIRIFSDDLRPPTVLDAYIEQDAHIHGT